jgi:hypothetical protein
MGTQVLNIDAQLLAAHSKDDEDHPNTRPDDAVR